MKGTQITQFSAVHFIVHAKTFKRMKKKVNEITILFLSANQLIDNVKWQMNLEPSHFTMIPFS